MKTKNLHNSNQKILFLILFFYSGFYLAQPLLPERNLTVGVTQGLYFGKFYDLGTGGTVSVDWQGIRNTTGGIIATPSSIVRPAIFEIKLCQGRNVTITYAPTSTLTGSNGGAFQLDLGPTEKGGSGAIFPIENNCDFITILRVGGTLHVPGNSPPGFYTGSFEISFDQQ